MVDILLRVTVVLRGVSGAVVMATSAGANKLFSQRRIVGASISGRERRFGELSARVVSEVVGVVWESNRRESEINVSGQPLW